MGFEKGPFEKLNKILTAIAVIMLAAWAWKWFGPGWESVREESGRTVFSYKELFSLGVAVSCGGYLLWRFLDWLFWKKYFH